MKIANIVGATGGSSRTYLTHLPGRGLDDEIPRQALPFDGRRDDPALARRPRITQGKEEDRRPQTLPGGPLTDELLGRSLAMPYRPPTRYLRRRGPYADTDLRFACDNGDVGHFRGEVPYAHRRRYLEDAIILPSVCL